MKVLLAPGPVAPEPGGVPLTTAPGALGAGQAARWLARGWRRSRPADELVLAPVPDGGPGTVAALGSDLVAQRRVLVGAGPLGQVREVDLVALSAQAPLAGGRRQGEHEAAASGLAGPASMPGRTWVLDAARLLAMPVDADDAAREAAEGTTRGLGEVLAQALALTEPGDVLVVGLGRSAVHDGGAGMLAGLGGVAGARELLAGRQMVLALADVIALGGLNGAGAGLGAVTSLSPQQVAEIDRAACAAASRAVSDAASIPSAALPLAAGSSGPLAVSAWGTGAGGGAAMVLQALGAQAWPGAQVMAQLTALEGRAGQVDLVVTAAGEVFDVVAGSVIEVAGSVAGGHALPAVMVAGQCVAPRGELAEAGIVSVYRVSDRLEPGQSWPAGTSEQVGERLAQVAERVARTWSR